MNITFNRIADDLPFTQGQEYSNIYFSFKRKNKHEIIFKNNLENFFIKEYTLADENGALVVQGKSYTTDPEDSEEIKISITI